MLGVRPDVPHPPPRGTAGRCRAAPRRLVHTGLRADVGGRHRQRRVDRHRRSGQRRSARRGARPPRKGPRVARDHRITDRRQIRARSNDDWVRERSPERSESGGSPMDEAIRTPRRRIERTRIWGIVAILTLFASVVVTAPVGAEHEDVEIPPFVTIINERANGKVVFEATQGRVYDDLVRPDDGPAQWLAIGGWLADRHLAMNRPSARFPPALLVSGRTARTSERPLPVVSKRRSTFTRPTSMCPTSSIRHAEDTSDRAYRCRLRSPAVLRR